MQLLYRVAGNILTVRRPAPFGVAGEVEHYIDIPEGVSQPYIRACFQAWSVTGLMVQTAFPWMKPEDREFLISGIKPDEWENIFGSSWDREDR